MMRPVGQVVGLLCLFSLYGCSAEGAWTIACDQVEPVTIVVSDSGGEISGTAIDPNFHPTEPRWEIMGSCSNMCCEFKLFDQVTGFNDEDEPMLACPEAELGTSVMCYYAVLGMDVSCVVHR